LDTLNDCKTAIDLSIQNIKKETKELMECYNVFFNIEKVFSSENGGKTRLNRQLFNENHDLIQRSIMILNGYLDDALENVKLTIQNILLKHNEFKKVDLVNLIFDDINFIEILQMDINNQVISNDSKNKLIKDIKELIGLKNRIFNLKYYIYMFDTTIFDRFLNKLGIEDLINSSFIFETIDSYALQYEELVKFSHEINNFYRTDEKIETFESLNSLLDLHKRRADNFTYANVRYKIAIDFYNNVDLKKALFINQSYLENIISSFIEQSCMDVVKKELKKGKIQKQIDVTISKVKGDIQVLVKNNGFEIKNVYNLFVSDIDNKYTLEAKNLASMLNAKLDVSSIENEGMQYRLLIKAK